MLTIEQSQIKEKANQFFDELNSAIISLAFAKNKNDSKKVDICQNKIESILDNVHNNCDTNTSDAFTRLLMAEYKEQVYESIFHPHFDRMDYDVLCEYDLLIESKPDLYTPYDHIHDPTHFMFDDGKHYYSFYEMMEKDGSKILDKWNEEDREHDDDF